MRDKTSGGERGAKKRKGRRGKTKGKTAQTVIGGESTAGGKVQSKGVPNSRR